MDFFFGALVFGPMKDFSLRALVSIYELFPHGHGAIALARLGLLHWCIFFGQFMDIYFGALVLTNLLSFNLVHFGQFIDFHIGILVLANLWTTFEHLFWPSNWLFPWCTCFGQYMDSYFGALVFGQCIHFYFDALFLWQFMDFYLGAFSLANLWIFTLVHLFWQIYDLLPWCTLANL